MTDDAVPPPAEPPAPRAAARLAARFGGPLPHPDVSADPAGSTRPATGGSSPEPDPEPPTTGQTVAAPWPDESGEHLVLPDAVPPEGMLRENGAADPHDLEPERVAAELLDRPRQAPAAPAPKPDRLEPAQVAAELLGRAEPRPGATGALVPPEVALADDQPFAAVAAAGALGRRGAANAGAADHADEDLDTAGDERDVEADGEGIDGAEGGRGRRGRRQGASKLLYALMGLLIVAVPVLGFTGYHLLSTSKNGTIIDRRRSSADPGYRALVETTPTMLVVHKGADGTPVGLTFLALSTADRKGGTLLQVPLDTVLETPLPGVATVRDGYTTGGLEGLTKAVSQVLTVGVGETIEVDDARLAALAAPVAPLRFDNPSTVELVGGRTIEAGKVELTAAEIGPFLAAPSSTDHDLDRLTRNQVVWQAWFEAVQASKLPGAVPGEVSSGIGRFIRGLAAGTVTEVNLPVTPVEGTTTLRADPVLVRLTMTQAVPLPVSGEAGQRVLVRVLSGVPGTAVPASVLQRLVYAGAQVAELGNADEVSVAATSIEYVNATQKDAVELMKKYLGVGTVKLVPDTGDSVGVTVVVGKDLLDHPPAALTAQELGR